MEQCNCNDCLDTDNKGNTHSLFCKCLIIAYITSEHITSKKYIAC